EGGDARWVAAARSLSRRAGREGDRRGGSPEGGADAGSPDRRPLPRGAGPLPPRGLRRGHRAAVHRPAAASEALRGRILDVDVWLAAEAVPGRTRGAVALPADAAHVRLAAPALRLRGGRTRTVGRGTGGLRRRAGRPARPDGRLRRSRQPLGA